VDSQYLYRRSKEEDVVAAYRALGVASAVLALLALSPAQADPPPAVALRLLYISRQAPPPPRATLSEPVEPHYGLMGAKFALQELNSSGKFLAERYELLTLQVGPTADIHSAAGKAISASQGLVIADLEPGDLLAVADLKEASGALILDARTSDDTLRATGCRSNVYHMLPSWTMRAEALGRLLARKGWNRWLLLSGGTTQDQQFASAFREVAAHNKAVLVGESTFIQAGPDQSTADAIARLTQETLPYQLVIVTDTAERFGAEVLFNTAQPALVAGTHGLSAVAWDPQFRDFAARSVQYRFGLLAARPMTERDYGNWLAVTAFGEAFTRGRVRDARGIETYMMSRGFQVAANKGMGLTFRSTDHQLRQPLLLFGPRSLVGIDHAEAEPGTHESARKCGEKPLQPHSTQPSH